MNVSRIASLKIGSSNIGSMHISATDLHWNKNLCL